MFLFGVHLQQNKRIDLSLKCCFGFSFASMDKLLAKLGCNMGYRKNKLTTIDLEELDTILSFLIRRKFFLRVGRSLENWLNLRMSYIKKMRSLKSYRHELFLPVRGQRTRKNAEIQKSKRILRKKSPVSLKKKKT